MTVGMVSPRKIFNFLIFEFWEGFDESDLVSQTLGDRVLLCATW